MIGAILPFLPVAIRFAEQLIKAPKSGSNRKAVVRDMARAAISKVAAISGEPSQPTDPELDGAIEAVFQQLKQSGALTQDVSADTTLIILQGRYQVVSTKGVL